jgi:hypothetical protein
MRPRFCEGNLTERGNFEYLDVDGTIILKYTLWEQGGLVHFGIGKKWWVIVHRIGASYYIKSCTLLTGSETVGCSRLTVLRGITWLAA